MDKVCPDGCMGTAGRGQEPGGGACVPDQCNAQQGLGAGGMCMDKK